MAKKYKRSASVQSRTNTVTEEVVEARPASLFSRRAAANEFAPDYTYIKNDLKRIGLISGTFFVILVVLSFILPLFQL